MRLVHGSQACTFPSRTCGTPKKPHSPLLAVGGVSASVRRLFAMHSEPFQKYTFLAVVAIEC